MKTRIEKAITTLFLFLFPAVSFALDPPTSPGAGGPTLKSVEEKILSTLSLIPTLFLALAMVFFLYGMLGYATAHDEKKMKEARDTIFYGIIGLTVMVSVWGLVEVARSILDI